MTTTLYDEDDIVGIEEREKVIEQHPMTDQELIERKKHMMQVAHNTLAKKKIHIGVTTHVLGSIKKIAYRKGIPYQTFVNSILHEYVHANINHNHI